MIYSNEEVRQRAAEIAKRLFDEGKSIKEVAQIMCLSESQTRSLVWR